MEPLLWKRMLEHILVTLIPLLAGMIIGGGLGVVLALVGRAVYRAAPALRKVALILPWRTIVMGLVLLIWSPYLVLRMRIGPQLLGITAGLIILLMSLPAATAVLLEEWQPTSLWKKLLGTVRTFASAAPVLVALLGFTTSGGLGFLIIQGVRTMRFGIAWQGALLVLLLALILDLLLGGAQLLAAYLLDPKKKTGPEIQA